MKKQLIIILLISMFGISAVFGQTLVSLEASRAENIGIQNINAQGVYPVRIRWSKPANDPSRTYQVHRSTLANSGFENVSANNIKDEGNFFIFIDTNPAAVPGKPYYYKVLAVNSAGQTSVYSETTFGYGALNYETYLREFTKMAVSSHKKLTYMNKSSAMSKLGEEEIKGSISGTLLYSAKVSGLGGRVIMQYTRYADFNNIDNNKDIGPMFIFTGNTNITSNMSQNGKMDGTVNVSGMYPGKIHYDNVQIKNGKAGGGTYGVEPQGFPRVEVDWKVADGVLN